MHPVPRQHRTLAAWTVAVSLKSAPSQMLAVAKQGDRQHSACIPKLRFAVLQYMCTSSVQTHMKTQLEAFPGTLITNPVC